MYRGCESAIGLLINLKVTEDKNKEEDQKLAYVENAEFWLKKYLFLCLGVPCGVQFTPVELVELLDPLLLLLWLL